MKLLVKAALGMSLLLSSVSVFGQERVLNEHNPEGYKHFKKDYADMIETANPTLLSWRMFYLKPSTGPNAEWFDAVKQGNLQRVKELLEGGQDIEAKDQDALGQTALGWAAFIGDEDAVDFLLAQNADLYATDRGDVTNALKSAGLGANVEVFKTIHSRLKEQIDLNDQTSDSQGETILIVAASNGRDDIVEYLLESGANPNLVTTVKDPKDPVYDQDALTIACQRGQAKIIGLLLKHGAVNHRTGKPACDY